MSDEECCCGDDGSTPGCPGGVLDGLCVEVTFAGIQRRTQVVATGGSTAYVLETLAGINKPVRFEYPGSAADDQECLAVLRCDTGCSGVPDTLEARGYAVAVVLGCVDGRVRVGSVILGIGLGTDEFGGTGFAWTAASPDPIDWPAAGITVDNQNTDDISESGDLGIGGQATVRVLRDCPPPAETYEVAERCSNPVERISVDASLAPVGLYGIEYDELAYRLTTLSTTEPPVAATWVEPVCPPKGGGDLFEAVRCRNSGSALEGPDKVAYAPEGGIPPGQGIVRFRVYRTYDLVAQGCDTMTCLFTLWYRATTTPAAPGLPIGQHVAGSDCANADSAVCVRSGCDPDVVPRPVEPCNLPPDQRPWWCDFVGLMERSAPEGGMPEGLMARQAQHLAEPLARQQRAANCKGCGD